jgi:hypothetical protein
MATSTTARNSDFRLLRRTLQGNSIFSGISGTAFTIGAGPITTFLGLSTPIILLVLGLVILVTAVLLYRAAASAIGAKLGLFFALIDAAWVVVSVLLLLAGWVPFTAGGKLAVGLIAVIVAVFASLEFYGSLWAR